MDAVWAHLADLPLREQRLVLMRFYGNMTQSQIGADHGVGSPHPRSVHRVTRSISCRIAVLTTISWAVRNDVRQSMWRRTPKKFRALALLAAGAITTFAVTAHPAFLDVPLVGLVVLATALGALWVGLGDERLIRVARQLLAFLSDLDRPASNRVPLEELLRPRAGSSSGGEAS